MNEEFVKWLDEQIYACECAISIQEDCEGEAHRDDVMLRNRYVQVKQKYIETEIKRIDITAYPPMRI